MPKHSSFFLLILSIVLFSCSNGQNSSKKVELTTEIGEIRFDSSITNFKQATVMSSDFGKKYIYSLHGKDDLTNDKPTTGFYIQPLRFMDYFTAKGYLDKFTIDYGQGYGVIKLENIKKVETTINNLKAYIITFSTIDDSNKKSYVTLAVLSKGTNSIEFSGNDFDGGIYSDKFYNTLKSLEM